MQSANSLKMKKLFRLAIWILFGFQQHAFAQSIPASDIWMLDIVEDSLVAPRRLVHTGRYNNQPMFSEDGKTLYFTMQQQDGQTDIAQLNLNTNEIGVVLSTEDSEYSPTPVPGKPALSVVRVEAPNQRQRLWEIDTLSRQASLIFESIEPVGYHAWLDRNSVALFLLGETFDLHLATRGSNQTRLLASNIGRTLQIHPVSGELHYVNKNHEPWMITAIGNDEKHRVILPLFPDTEDFALDDEGRLWMASDSKIYRVSPDHSKWILIEDLSEFGIFGITRIIINLEFSLVSIVASISN